MSVLSRVAGVFGIRSYNNVITAKDIFEGASDQDGVATVSELSALQLSTVMACVKVLSETIACLPLVIYKRRSDGGRDKATEHPLYNVLHDSPNRLQTSFDWRQQQQALLALHGNSISEVIRDGRGNITELRPLRHTFTYEMSDDGRMVYYCVDWKGSQKVLTDSEVYRLMGLSLDGKMGVSVIGHARNTFDIAGSAERYGNSVFKGGGTKRVVLEAPQGRPLNAAQIKQLKEQWEDMYAGNSKTAVLEGGLKAAVMGIDPKDTQFLETRRFQVEEIARLFRVPLHLVGDLTRSTNNNIEQQSLEFTKYTMMPWLTRWEQGINKQLLKPSEKRDYFVKFNVDGLLRGDITTRYKAYRDGIFNSFLTPNEVRIREDLNPIDGLDAIIKQSAMIGFDESVANDTQRSKANEKQSE